MSSLPMIELLPQASDGFRAFVAGPEPFREKTGVDLAEGMASYSRELVEPFILSLDGRTPWTLGYFIVDRSLQKAVGLSGFKGPPSADGVIEIAYAVAPEFQNRGYATAAVAMLLELCFAQPEPRLVIAHTLPGPNASCQVLAKSGFLKAAEVIDPDDGPVWRWERKREP